MGKEECIQRISSSPLFSLNRSLEPTAYKRETEKMAGYLFQYTLCVNEKLYSEYGTEIFETALRCIKNYDRSKGDFLHYFNVAWQVEFRRIKAKTAQNNHLGGMHITEDDKRDIRKIFKFAQMQGKDYLSQSFAQTISEAMGIDVVRVEELIAIMDTQVVSDSATNDAGESFSLFDLLESQEKTCEKQIEELDDSINFMIRLDKFYLTRQERQKPILSALITARLVEEVSRSTQLVQALKSRAFYNKQIVMEYERSGKVPMDCEIAKEFGVLEQSLSRTWNTFIQRYKGEIYGC